MSKLHFSDCFQYLKARQQSHLWSCALIWGLARAFTFLKVSVHAPPPGVLSSLSLVSLHPTSLPVLMLPDIPLTVLCLNDLYTFLSYNSDVSHSYGIVRPRDADQSFVPLLKSLAQCCVHSRCWVNVEWMKEYLNRKKTDWKEWFGMISLLIGMKQGIKKWLNK